MTEFLEFPKMARLSRECVITEKIDGTNAQIYITDDGQLFVGSRTKWITPQDDNAGFARWVEANKEEVMKLGPGRHFGEWWGLGIQRNYGLKEKRLSLFNTIRWCLHDAEPQPTNTSGGMQERLPKCIGLVPVIHRGIFDTIYVEAALSSLNVNGSFAAPGFMKPEGIVVYHVAAGVGFKKTLENDEVPKSLVKSESVSV